MKAVMRGACNSLLQKIRRRTDVTFPLGSHQRRFIRGAAWSVSGSVLSQALGLATLVVVARIVGRDGYGALAMIRSTIAVFAAFSTGVSFAVTKHISASLTHDRDRVGRLLWLSTVGAVAVGVSFALGLAAASGHLSRTALNATHLVDDLTLASGVVLFTVISSIQIGALAGLEAFRAIALVNLLRAVIGVPVTSFAALAFGLRGAILGLLVTAAVGCILAELALRRACANKQLNRVRGGVAAELPRLWQFSSVLFLCDLVRPPATWVSNALLVRQPYGYAQMGVFSAAMDWMVVAMALPSLIATTLLPIASELHANGDSITFVRFIRRALTGIAAVSAASSVVLLAAAPAIYSLYGKGFGGRFDVLATLLAAAALGNVSNTLRAVAISSDRHRGTLASYVAYATCMVAIMWLLPQRDAHSRALSQLGAEAALLIGLLVVNAPALRPQDSGASLPSAPERFG